MADPTLPQLTVDTTDPLSSCERPVDCSSTGGHANTAARLAAFIAALADAKFKDYIITEPGDTLDGNFELKAPATSALGATSGFVVIRPRGFDSVVPIGNRATDNSGMTTLRGVNSASGAGHCDAVVTVPSNGTSYYWISGLEVVPKAGTFCDSALVWLSPSSNADNPANHANYMMVDRAYIHGDMSGGNGGPGTQRGLQWAGQYVACINSSIDEIKTTNAQNDSQSITMAFGSGPVLIDNNLLACTCEGVLFETPTGERLTHDPSNGKSVTYHTGSNTVTLVGLTVDYDYSGKTFNFDATPAATATISSISIVGSTTTLTLSGALSGVADGTTGTAFIQYNHAASFFPQDITITRNYFLKKPAWNIQDPTFERNTGADTGLTNMSIHASDNTKLAVGTFSGLTYGTQIYITSSSPWTSGFAYVTNFDGSGNAIMNRSLGTAGSTGGTARLGYSVKNGLEFKSGTRTNIRGNVFDGSWCGGQSYVLTVTPRYTNCPAGDHTFLYNKIRNTFAIMVVAPSNTYESGTPPPWLIVAPISLKHNLFENIQSSSSGPYWAQGSDGDLIQWREYGSGGGTINSVAGDPAPIDDLTFEHNTIAGASSSVGTGYAVICYGDGTTPRITGARHILRNNIIFNGSNKFIREGTASVTGTLALDYWMDTTRTVTKNILFDTTETNAVFTAGTDAGNTFLTDHSTIGFTDYAGGDYTITGANATAASDGTMLGADIATLDEETAGCITGVWTPSSGGNPSAGAMAMTGVAGRLGFGMTPSTP